MKTNSFKLMFGATCIFLFQSPLSKSGNMARILNVKAREVLDSRGNPTVECDVITENGLFRASVPSGASTGVHEALELRDWDLKRFNGKGVLKAVGNVNKKIAPLILGMNPAEQEKIDKKIIAADGTKNKSNFGANAILAVSVAVCKAGAESKGKTVYQHIGELCGNKRFVLPMPMVLVLEGGKHADGSTDIQEFMVVPKKAKSFSEAVKIGVEVYQGVGKVLKSEGFNTNVGFEGAFGPKLKGNFEAFDFIVQGIRAAGYVPGKDVGIAVDVAASELFGGRKYHLNIENKELSGKEMIAFIEELAVKYPVVSVEDGLSQDDWKFWPLLVSAAGKKIQIVGDDLTVTNVERIAKAAKPRAISAAIVKPNQIGTVTESIEAVKLLKKNKMHAIISHRGAETEDSFLADFAVGTGAGQCKFGAPCRGERLAKYNQLLRIEEELGKRAVFAGAK